MILGMDCRNFLFKRLYVDVAVVAACTPCCVDTGCVTRFSGVSLQGMLHAAMVCHYRVCYTLQWCIL